jgi:hypothetical protein
MDPSYFMKYTWHPMCLHVAVLGGGGTASCTGHMGRLQGKELSSFTIYYYSHPAPVLIVRPASVCPYSYCPSDFSSPLFLLSVRRLHSSGFRADFTNMRICLHSSFTIYNVGHILFSLFESLHFFSHAISKCLNYKNMWAISYLLFLKALAFCHEISNI